MRVGTPPHKLRRKASGVLLGAVLAAAGGFLIYSRAFSPAPPKPSGIPLMSAVPSVTLEAAGAPASTLAVPDDAKRPMILVFLSSRCEACARDTPLWVALNRQAAERGVTLALISVDQSREVVKRYEQKLALTEKGLKGVPVWFSDAVGPRLNIRFVPSYWAVDSSGRLTMQSTGVTPAGTSTEARAKALLDATTRPAFKS